VVANSPPFTRPNVSKCQLTGHWIMNMFGTKHDCARHSYYDEGFRHWSDAVARANEVARKRWMAVRDYHILTRRHV